MSSFVPFYIQQQQEPQLQKLINHFRKIQMHIPIHNRQSDRQTNRATYRQTDIQTQTERSNKLNWTERTILSSSNKYWKTSFISNILKTFVLAIWKRQFYLIRSQEFKFLINMLLLIGRGAFKITTDKVLLNLLGIRDKKIFDESPNLWKY